MNDEPCQDSPTTGTVMQDVLTVLRKADKTLEAVTYSYSTENSLPTSWLIQSSPSDSECQLLDTIQNEFKTVVEAAPSQPHFVDILQLGNDNPADEFQAAMIDSIVNLAKSAQQEVIIRYLEGNPSDTPEAKCFTFLEQLKSRYSGPPANVFFYSASLDYPWVSAELPNNPTPGSWNHAKIFAIDGRSSIVGGQNYWNDYIPRPDSRPPHDVSMLVNGAATAAAHAYSNFLWTYVASSGRGKYTYNRSWRLGAPAEAAELPPNFDPSTFPTPPQPEAVPILAVGNLGLWLDGESATLAAELAYALTEDQAGPKNTYPQIEDAENPLLYFPFSSFDREASKASQASTTARHLLLQTVGQNGHLRISQQKVADTDVVKQTGIVLWPGEFMQAIVSALKDKNATVDILVSYHTAGFSGGYSDDMGSEALRGVIIDMLATAFGGDRSRAAGLGKQLLTVRQTPFDTFNHAKAWIVDDSVFYVGSDNVYPGYLQEYGYVIGSTIKTVEFTKSYWDPIWALGV